MAQIDPTATEAAGEQEIGEVLEAERRAVEAVARCQREAEEIVAAARAAARDIGARTDRRVSRLRGRLEQRLQDELARIRAQADEVRSRPVGQDPRAAHLQAAIVRFAARLTGGGR